MTNFQCIWGQVMQQLADGCTWQIVSAIKAKLCHSLQMASQCIWGQVMQKFADCCTWKTVSAFEVMLCNSLQIAAHGKLSVQDRPSYATLCRLLHLTNCQYIWGQVMQQFVDGCRWQIVSAIEAIKLCHSLQLASQCIWGNVEAQLHIYIRNWNLELEFGI